MSNFSKIFFVLWIVLAIAMFVGAFYVTPMIVKVLGIAFGILNMTVILGWIIATIQEVKNNKQKGLEG